MIKNEAERQVSIDAVRGFAVLGILLMNIVGMGLPAKSIRTSAESLAVSNAAGIPLPTTSPTAIAQRVAPIPLPCESDMIGMIP